MFKSQIPNPKSQINSKLQTPNSKTHKFQVLVIWSLVIIWNLVLGYWNLHCLFAQEADLTFALDVASKAIPLPKIFKPNIDLSGRGFHRECSWPQGLAAPEALDKWQKDIGFSGIYRLQYSLWDIIELAKEKDSQKALLNNYENTIKKITEVGGIVILDIFGMPKGLGKVLDKKSAPSDLRAFKALVKKHIRNLSCDKRYNIWYELWNAPDLDDFFLGREQEYLNLYRALAEVIKELETETKIYIPLGGPSTSWWFQNLDGNNIITPEKSLIYNLIRFCSRYHLPLDFITWHAYSSDPKIEKETTVYNKPSLTLIRDWLSYFNLDRNIPLIVDEWNYDRDANVLPGREERSNICASYIMARLKNMYEAGLDYQLYFSLEDFKNNKEGINRNVGVFWFDPEASKYSGGPKSTYNAFRMLANLGQELFSPSIKLNDEFVGVIATKAKDYIAIIIYNYIDPDIYRNFLSRKIPTLRPAERVALLRLAESDRLEKIMQRQLDVSGLRLRKKVQSLLNQAQELNDRASKFINSNRNIKIEIKNLKGDYLYQRYIIDASCSKNCEFIPVEEHQVSAVELFQELLSLNPYSVNMIILKKKPPQPESISQEGAGKEAAHNTDNTAN